MKYVLLPDEKPRRLTFYLAMEEHVAGKLDEEDCFFIWQVRPTVIFGRHQLMENEVNLSYCRTHGIETYRRKSGGGCVYADMGNVMLSYVTRDENVQLTYNRYVNLVVLALYRLGIEAHATGRNDILVDGRKVSGSAFHHFPGGSIVHGTLLYDTQMEHMIGSLTPSTEKLHSKGVESVRQHITLLKEHTTKSLTEVKAVLRDTFCNSETCLSADDIARIEEIEQSYLSTDFILGSNPRHTLVRHGRVEGAGSLEASLELKNNIIKAIALTGDFFPTGDVEALLAPLHGLPFTREAIEAALPEDLGGAIRHLTRRQFIDLLFP
ncbi:MAG: lipoyltransferase [Prevotella sp.]|nr:lipoyltransferase [Prevotella sp.]